jgi:MoxR-like ATPase
MTPPSDRIDPPAGQPPASRPPTGQPPASRPPTGQPATGQPAGPGGSPLQPVLYEVKRVIVGQDVLLERMAVALLSGGHLLVEGVPGLAKTLSVKSLAAAIGGQFQRIQFTPDLVPADLTGTRVYHQHSGEFQTQLGPVFTNLLLADEINRAPAKVQSALLEVMQEHQVTIGRETFAVPEPFLVMATQNPIESEGTYPLPEAQVDRFMMKVIVGYPTPSEEHAIVDRSLRPADEVREMLTPADLIRMQEQVREIYVDPAVVDYAVRLVTATRRTYAAGLGDLKRYISYGASPRASIALVTGARALAFTRDRDYVLPADVSELALDVLRHRIVLSYEALADDISADSIITKVLEAVPAPEVVLSGR